MKTKYITSLLSGALLLFITGCQSGFLDINDDPNKPTVAELPKLLTGAEYNVAYSYAPGYYLGNSLPSYVQHLTSRESDNYGIAANHANLGNSWSQAYTGGLKNTDAVINAAEESGNLIYAGIGKLLKAYLFSTIVDLWGDIPYTEFNVDAIITPKADSGKDIYNSLLKLIDEAVADLNNTEAKNLLKPGSADLIYGGSVDKWNRMANTLKLRLLIQSRKAKADITNWDAQLQALITANNFIKDGEDFELRHTAKDNPDERNPAYKSDYTSSQSYYINPWFYEIMAGKTLNATKNPFAGIQDPRMPYYWVNQSKATSAAQNPTDYRDGAFISILMASNSTAASNAIANSSTFIGIYPCGGKFDDGQGGKCDSKVGTGIAPEKMMQAYSVPFMLAELILAGEISGDAKTQLEAGIEASIVHVNSVSLKAKGSVNVPSIADEDISDFITKVKAKYDAASNEQKMEIVMTQKWIANFFNSVEAYNDIRRTGYPVLFAPADGYAKSPYKSDQAPTPGPIDVPLKGLNPFQRIMWYPSDEIARNPNMSNSGRNVAASNVFWDK